MTRPPSSATDRPADHYPIVMRGNIWRFWCAIAGHSVYSATGWYFYEHGCTRCKLHIRYQWDLFEETP